MDEENDEINGVYLPQVQHLWPVEVDIVGVAADICADGWCHE